MPERMNYAAAAPGGIKALRSVSGYVLQSGLARTLIDFIYLRVSQINGYAYFIDMHSRDLLKANLPIEKVMLGSAWDEAGSVLQSKRRESCRCATAGGSIR